MAEPNELAEQAVFFATPADFRAWFEDHHTTDLALWVGFYKKDSGQPSITWPESVDQALCFGWIDGIRKSIDAVSYRIRFTPRKPRSIWSAVNIKRAKELIELGQMYPAGLKAFEARTDEKSAIYSYEQQDDVVLDSTAEQQFRANEKAWMFFEARPASYRRAAIWWVISAKRRDTQVKRLAELINYSEQEQLIPQFLRPAKSK